MKTISLIHLKLKIIEIKFFKEMVMCHKIIMYLAVICLLI